ncbi:hypothetical protein [Sediminivirga luteola]|uniref:hypothetical protein n=1 Tax=Sediminivirga luteola TaxID=1774748 RepID=UPI001F5A8EBD|nr:hypothetical protein [Sediminivirga luteola]MCI2266172.1 hypothetical protein [Sediminivirga luteola]
MAALSALPQHVRQDELDELAGRVIAADVVYLFGQGNAIVLTIARRYPETALASLDRLGVILEHFET